MLSQHLDGSIFHTWLSDGPGAHGRACGRWRSNGCYRMCLLSQILIKKPTLTWELEVPPESRTY